MLADHVVKQPPDPASWLLFHQVWQYTLDPNAHANPPFAIFVKPQADQGLGTVELHDRAASRAMDVVPVGPVRLDHRCNVMDVVLLYRWSVAPHRRVHLVVRPVKRGRLQQIDSGRFFFLSQPPKGLPPGMPGMRLLGTVRGPG